MKRKTMILGSSTGMLAAAAFAGMIGGASSRATASAMPGLSHSTAAKAAVVANAGIKARNMDGATTQHDCKGKNDCKARVAAKPATRAARARTVAKATAAARPAGRRWRSNQEKEIGPRISRVSRINSFLIRVSPRNPRFLYRHARQSI